MVDGLYPMERDNLLELGGLQLAAKYGQFDEAVHTLAYIKWVVMGGWAGLLYGCGHSEVGKVMSR